MWYLPRKFKHQEKRYRHSSKTKHYPLRAPLRSPRTCWSLCWPPFGPCKRSIWQVSGSAQDEFSANFSMIWDFNYGILTWLRFQLEQLWVDPGRPRNPTWGFRPRHRWTRTGPSWWTSEGRLIPAEPNVRPTWHYHNYCGITNHCIDLIL